MALAAVKSMPEMEVTDILSEMDAESRIVLQSCQRETEAASTKAGVTRLLVLSAMDTSTAHF